MIVFEDIELHKLKSFEWNNSADKERKPEEQNLPQKLLFEGNGKNIDWGSEKKENPSGPVFQKACKKDSNQTEQKEKDLRPDPLLIPYDHGQNLQFQCCKDQRTQRNGNNQKKYDSKRQMILMKVKKQQTRKKISKKSFFEKT